jgi:hypothetical protein
MTEMLKYVEEKQIKGKDKDAYNLTNLARELDPYFSTVEKFYIVLYVYMSA